MSIALSGYSSAANLILPQAQLSTSPSRPVSDNSASPVQSESPSSGKASSDMSSNSDSQTSKTNSQHNATIDKLKARDQEVRLHERAHLAAAGGYATGGASYSYQVGPDGRRYAIGGEVGIDTSPVSGDPEATIQKAIIVQRAALAPVHPSSQDYQVQAQAAQMEAQARTELASKSQGNSNGDEVASKPNSNGLETVQSKSEKGLTNNNASAANPLNSTAQARVDFELRLRLNA